MKTGDDHDCESTMTRMRDTNQSRGYAARKASQAVEKLGTASDAERAQAQVWTRLCGALTGFSQDKPGDDR